MSYKYDPDCLHCKIEEIIDSWKWRGNLTKSQKKRMILKDLLNVLFDLLWYKPK